jgi:hypothetical protein
VRGHSVIEAATVIYIAAYRRADPSSGDKHRRTKRKVSAIGNAVGLFIAQSLKLIFYTANYQDIDYKR